jgi:transcriptional regulator of acetoin/glycerol metabolism
MTAATVLIPTHSHVESLRHAVASVQQQSLRDFEKVAIVKTLKANQGNISIAAKVLGISRTTLYAKMKEYEL